MISRRNALTVLGLAGADYAGFAIEDSFAKESEGPIAQHERGRMPLGRDCKMMSSALRALADEMDAKTIDTLRLHVGTEVTVNKIITQVLTVEFVIPIKSAV